MRPGPGALCHGRSVSRSIALDVTHHRPWMKSISRPTIANPPSSQCYSTDVSQGPATIHRSRSLHNASAPSTNPSSAASQSNQDWSASQYLKYAAQRNRPLNDLLAHITPLPDRETPRIIDLGCGPGNSTQALLKRYLNANMTGMDSSPDMLAKARAALPDVEFVSNSLEVYARSAKQEEEPVDLYFSNAVFHWLRSSIRIPTIIALLQRLKPGGVFAMQVPDNYLEPSHLHMRKVARMAKQPWSKYFKRNAIGDLDDETRPDLDPVESLEEWFCRLQPHCQSVDLWRTEYCHELASAGDVVEWVKGTGLMPFLNRMGEDEEAKSAFVELYKQKVARSYKHALFGSWGNGRAGVRRPPGDETVLLKYPRLFVVAVKK